RSPRGRALLLTVTDSLPAQPGRRPREYADDAGHAAYRPLCLSARFPVDLLDAGSHAAGADRGAGAVARAGARLYDPADRDPPSTALGGYARRPGAGADDVFTERGEGQIADRPFFRCLRQRNCRFGTESAILQK